mgnify:CR=1 FL=1|tara:strand:- start:424 stop:717 length:294 start_codon:yes stop_codon:yes gene_type:complete
MLKLILTGQQNVMRRLEKEKDAFMTRVAEDIKRVAVSNTPIDKGRARRGWQVTKTSKTRKITNRVPYIDLLEQGRSKQAPRGIIRPTVREISRRRYK